MIEIIDNLGYTGNKSNFSRDNMSWSDMQLITEDNLDKGHIVFCINSDDKRGHYVFVGNIINDDSTVSPMWSKITNENGQTIGTDITLITEDEIDTLTDI